MMAVAFATISMATEIPPKDFQEIMKANGVIIDTTLGIEREAPEQQSGGRRGASLRAHMKSKDYEGIASDAATLKANFTKVEAFWTQRKADDAINFSKAAIKAAGDLESAAKAKDDARISESAKALGDTCRDCHQSHRVMQLTDKTFQIM
jgi:cytochrome c556